MTEQHSFERGIRSAQLGILVNAVLAVAKLVAGIVGNAYALVADAVESTADIFSSVVVLGGLRIAGREPTSEFPFGYGRAETLAAAVVALMLLGTAIGISVEAIREIQTPHHAPAPWTLAVLVTVIAVKWLVSRRVAAAGTELGSRAVQADAWHHLSDAVTSAAAFAGISVALIMGPGWEPADDWAALLAAGIIFLNGALMLKGALYDLMDRTPDSTVVAEVRRIAEGVEGVSAIEKLAVRRAGMNLFVYIHVQAPGTIPLEEAHNLGGRVKSAIRASNGKVAGVLVHMEPYTPASMSEPHSSTVEVA